MVGHCPHEVMDDDDGGGGAREKEEVIGHQPIVCPVLQWQCSFLVLGVKYIWSIGHSKKFITTEKPLTDGDREQYINKVT